MHVVQMAELFATDRTSINRHIRNIFQTQELNEKSTCAKIAQVRMEGERAIKRIQPYYNLDMIISVGYRVNSIQGTRFRQWANQVLKEHMLKGFSVNQRLVSHENKLENMREVHDRFVIVDDVVYHVGASFKDLGNQMTAFSVLNFVTKEQVLAMVK